MQGWEASRFMRKHEARLARLVGDRPVLVDCSYERAHAGVHVPHPETGRLVCRICHPIPESVEGK